MAACVALSILTIDGRQPTPLFEFRVRFWNSLHHELHALARPRPAPPDASSAPLDDGDGATWSRAVEGYRALGRRSLLFDEGVAMFSATLSAWSDDGAIATAAIAPTLRALLVDAAPAYRRSGWPGHRRSAAAFIDGVAPLLDRYGNAIATRIAASYDTTWGEPVPVDLVRDAGPPGNAHTTVRPHAHVTIAAGDPRHQGAAGMELLFHEASHAWGGGLQDVLLTAARAEGRAIPPDLWHTVLFFSAGEVTRRVLAEAGMKYELYAATQQLATGPYAAVWPAVVAHWTPRLDGKASRAEAATALVRAVGTLPPG